MTNILNAETVGGTNNAVQITGMPVNLAKMSVLAYVKKTGAGGGNLGYVWANNTSTASQGGMRTILEQAAGGPRPVTGIGSSGTANQPALSGTPASVSDGGGKVADNTWQYVFYHVVRALSSSGFRLKIDGVACVTDTGGTSSGSGSNVDETGREWMLFNRGPWGGALGRHLQAEVGYVAVYRELTDVQEAAARTNGPLTTAEGCFDELYFVYANGQLYLGALGTGIAVGNRTTRITSSAPPNVALGDSSTSAVSSDFDATYNVIGTVQKDLDPTYDIIGAVQKDLDASYNVLSATAVSSDLDVSYNVIGRVSADLDATYSVIGRVTKDLDASFAVQEATPYVETSPFKRNNGTLRPGLTGLTVGLLKMSDFSFAGAFPSQSTNGTTARMRVEDMDLERGEEYAVVTKNAAGVLGVERCEAL